MWTIVPFTAIGMVVGIWLAIRYWKSTAPNYRASSGVVLYIMGFTMGCGGIGCAIGFGLPNGGRYHTPTQRIDLLPVYGIYILQTGEQSSITQYCLIRENGKIKIRDISDLYVNRKDSPTKAAYILVDDYPAKKSWKKIDDWGAGIDTDNKVEILYLPKGSFLTTDQ